MSSTGNSPTPSASSDRHDEYGKTKKRKITRTKKGCLTCRKRRKLCDLDRPDCGACECKWPEPPSERTRRESIATTNTLEPAQSDPDATIESHRVVCQSPTATRNDAQSDWQTNSMYDLMGIMGGSSVPAAAMDDAVTMQRHPSNGPLLGSNIASVHTTTTGMTPFALGDLNSTTPADPLASLLDGVMFDEATLQLWAAGCLAIPATQTIDPFQSLSDLLRQPSAAPDHTAPRDHTHASRDHPHASRDHTSTFIVTQDRPKAPTIPAPGLKPPAVSPHHAHLLKHYQASLSSLVSCTGDSESAPSAFAAFTKLAEASSSSEAGQGLQLSILAWAGRHMVNQGEIKLETISDKLGEKGMKIVMDRLESWNGRGEQVGETERMTLLAGALMVISFKICRGDVWGFDALNSYLKLLSDSLYQVNSPGAPPDSMPFHFFENLVYHDLTSSETYAKGPIVPYSVLMTYSNPSSDYLNTLTGACFPVFCRFNRIATLASQRRQKSRGQPTRRAGDESALWSDEELYDLVSSAREIEEELKDDKKQMEAMVKNKPSLSSHRFLHEAYRITGLMALHSFVLCEPPSAFGIQLLVRQSLSLLEEMWEKNLPGLCSIHLVLFVTALCCCKSDPASTQDGETGDADCQRIERLYENMRNDYAFGNLSRSPKIYREVWERNQQGRIHVDWLDVIDDFGWELFLV